METWEAIPRLAPDPELPGSGDLVGPAGADAVCRTLARDGWTVQSQRPVQAVYHPGRSLLVRHTAWACRGAEQQRFAVCTELRADGGDAGDGVVHVEDGLASWVYPADPGLPALSQAATDEMAGEWARELVPDARSAVVNSVAYRPRRRAVLRYRVRSSRASETPRQVLYAKVMPEAEADRAWELGEALRPQDAPLALPASQPAPGVLLFDELPGASLRDLLLRDGPLPNPDRIVTLMDRVAELELPWERPAGRPRGLRCGMRGG
ncbi:MAG: hypothetical protein U5Q44_06800 [Dehalococcoidia bacterium]|nr:hypothetical protein [Dehalococcoidia bacterium]